MRRFVTMITITELNEWVVLALKEDVGEGDHSTLCSIDASARSKAVLKIKQDGIIAGIAVARAIFYHVDPSMIFKQFVKDGESVQNGALAFEVEMGVHGILQSERLVLNTMQRMSGIATLTKKYADKIVPYKTKLLDTRKTTPLFRLFEKEAVRLGGGCNHRFGLYDMIMLKDNHIDYCGSITKALLLAKEYVLKNKPGMKIEIETRNISDVQEVMEAGGADRIMLDNFTPAEIQAALKIINHQAETEASGGIHLDNIISFAETGVDFISCGALIHQAQSIDLSLKAVINN